MVLAIHNLFPRKKGVFQIRFLEWKMGITNRNIRNQIF